MLTEFQAREIVQASIRKTNKNAEALGDLRDAGITPDNLGELVKTLVADPENGVPRFQHFLDPNIVGVLTPETTIEDLVDKVLRLSAGKLCSNPNTPHPQTCCPYPANCPQCGYKVL